MSICDIRCQQNPLRAFFVSEGDYQQCQSNKTLFGIAALTLLGLSSPAMQRILRQYHHQRVAEAQPLGLSRVELGNRVVVGSMGVIVVVDVVVGVGAVSH
jgi:hypothetical protein